MGGAMMKGILNSGKCDRTGMMASDSLKAARNRIEDTLGIATSEDNKIENTIGTGFSTDVHETITYKFNVWIVYCILKFIIEITLTPYSKSYAVDLYGFRM